MAAAFGWEEVVAVVYIVAGAVLLIALSRFRVAQQFERALVIMMMPSEFVEAARALATRGGS
jgi:hypothetical protein